MPLADFEGIGTTIQDRRTGGRMRHSTKSVTVWKAELDKMSQMELAELKRFAPAGHVVFTDDSLSEHFNQCFEAKGGMTTEVSKALGWGKP
jgi:hypothetical protein